MSSLVSVLIPARNERFLTQTIKSLLANAAGNVEVLINVDEGHPDEIVEDPRVRYIFQPKSIGMRPGINACAALAKGDFFLKLDAHCLLGEGYDVILAENCDQDWLAVPSRYSLDPIKWAIERNGKMRRDYHYLTSPIGGLLQRNDYTMHGIEWWARCKERKDPKYDIDDEMSSQGSCWFIPRRQWDKLGGMHVEGYGTFTNEFQELGLQTWLGGGRVVINKKTWYAHLHKGKQYGRMYRLDEAEKRRGQRYCATYWMNNRWEKRVHDLEWLIDKFWPVPDWPENWKELHAQGFGPDSIKK